MGIYQKNLGLIKEHRPLLYGQIASWIDDETYLLVEDDSSFVNLNLGKQNLYSQKPDVEYQRSQELSQFDYPRILVFDGVGLGYHIFEYLKSPHDSIKEFLLVENDPKIFLAALKVHDFSELILRFDFDFCVGAQGQHIPAFLKEYFCGRERVVYSAHCEHFYFYPSLKLHGEYYVSFAEAMKTTVDDLKSYYAARGEDNFRALLNITRNLPALFQSPTVHDFFGLFENTPAVIVAAGPSLDQHLEQLKEYQDRFLVVSCDGALKSLQTAGIEPDLVFCIERDQATCHYFEGLPRDFEAPLVTLPVIHPHSVGKYPARIIMLPRQPSFGKWLYPDKESFFIGTSVAPMAYSVLCRLGCSQVYLLGQDLAYDRKTLVSHSQAVGEDIKEFLQDMRKKQGIGCEIEGNDGKPIASNVFWHQYLKDYEYLIHTLKRPCYNVIDEQQGAKIHNASLLSPKEFWQSLVPKFDQVGVKEVIRNQLNQFTPQLSEHSYAQKRDKMLSVLGDLEDHVCQLSQDVSQAYLDDPVENLSQDLMTRYKNRFGEWDQKFQEILQRHPQDYQSFLWCLFHSEYLQLAAEREKVSPKDGMHFIHNYVALTQKIFMHLMSWCQRARWLLKTRWG